MTTSKLVAKVISTKMTKTVVVAVETPKRHPLYSKFSRNTKKLKAHTDIQLVAGDMVEITSSKPFGKTVYFRVVRKVN